MIIIMGDMNTEGSKMSDVDEIASNFGIETSTNLEKIGKIVHDD